MTKEIKSVGIFGAIKIDIILAQLVIGYWCHVMITASGRSDNTAFILDTLKKYRLTDGVVIGPGKEILGVIKKLQKK